MSIWSTSGKTPCGAVSDCPFRDVTLANLALASVSCALAVSIASSRETQINTLFICLAFKSGAPFTRDGSGLHLKKAGCYHAQPEGLVKTSVAKHTFIHARSNPLWYSVMLLTAYPWIFTLATFSGFRVLPLCLCKSTNNISY